LVKRIELCLARSKPVTNYAQTNIQLFNQLRQAQYSETDLRYICNAYQFAVQIFTSRFRGSGKPFLSHLVGTASILVSVHAGINVITAGLLHAAYIYGEYGTEEKGITDAKREKVQQAVGVETEELISKYTALKWNKTTIPAICDRLNTLDPTERQVLLIRLANELEDHLDHGVLYCGNAEQRREYIRSSLYLSVEMACKLGFPTLAAALECNFRNTFLVELPAAVRTSRNSSYLLTFT
jgi:(p)ppGpp synthase/HD superfamily hydrolase